MALDFMAAQRLLDRYHQDPRGFTDHEAEQVAAMAHSTGLDFRREHKPLQKLAFDAADIGMFGLLPNEWRPTSRGETVYGESGPDKAFGGLGTIAGLTLSFYTGGLALKGASNVGKRAMDYFRTGGGPAAAGGSAAAGSEVAQKTAEGISRTGRGLLPAYGESQGALGLLNKRTQFPITQTSGPSIPLGGEGGWRSMYGIPQPTGIEALQFAGTNQFRR